MSKNIDFQIAASELAIAEMNLREHRMHERLERSFERAHAENMRVMENIRNSRASERYINNLRQIESDEMLDNPEQGLNFGSWQHPIILDADNWEYAKERTKDYVGLSSANPIIIA